MLHMDVLSLEFSLQSAVCSSMVLQTWLCDLQQGWGQAGLRALQY